MRPTTMTKRLEINSHTYSSKNRIDFKTLSKKRDSMDPFLQERNIDENAEASKIFSIFYGLVVFIVGVAFSISRAIIPSDQAENISKLASIFFTYLYWLSILWIVFCIIDIVRHKRKSNVLSTRINSLDSSHIQMNIFRKCNNMKFSSTSNLRTFRGSSEKHEIYSMINEDDCRVQDQHGLSRSCDNLTVFLGRSVRDLIRTHSLKSNIQHSSDITAQQVIGYNYDDYSTAGGLYIRVGIGVFCLGTVVHSGLSILSNLENLSCTTWLVLIDDCSRLLFSFVQFFFIFKHSNLIIRAHGNFARLAVMHVLVTNLCVWFRMVVNETKSQLIELSAHDMIAEHMNSGMATANRSMKINPNLLNRYRCTLSVKESFQLTTFINEGYIKLKPILYPCTIEFSLMCLTLFFLIWENIGKTFTHRMSNRSSSKNVFMVNCHASIKGLFIGMIIFSCSVISIILYAIFQNKISDEINIMPTMANGRNAPATSHQHASLIVISTHSPSPFINRTPKTNVLYSIAIVEIVNLCLLIISLFATIYALMKIRKLQYRRITTRFDNVLIIVSLAGIYLYSIFSAFALFYNESPTSWIVYIKIVIVILEFIEGSVHAFFILMALRKRLIQRRKQEYPAREVITLMIILDLSLWFEETTTTTKHEANPYQLAFYHIIPWAIIAAIATPLQIFFRFHASVCLSHVWENMYAMRSYEAIAPHGL